MKRRAAPHPAPFVAAAVALLVGLLVPARMAGAPVLVLLVVAGAFGLIVLLAMTSGGEGGEPEPPVLMGMLLGAGVVGLPVLAMFSPVSGLPAAVAVAGGSTLVVLGVREVNRPGRSGRPQVQEALGVAALGLLSVTTALGGPEAQIILPTLVAVGLAVPLMASAVHGHDDDRRDPHPPTDTTETTP